MMIKSLLHNKEELNDLYTNKGLSLKEIGDICGVPFQTVYKWVKKNNIPTRSWSTKGMKFEGRKLSDEHKEKLRVWHTGRPLNPEHKKKVIETLSKGWVKGEKHHSWKGGIYHNKYGYIMQYDPIRGKHIRQHRLFIENEIGRLLLKTEHVHHINGIKDDNRIENLKLVSNYEHALIHWTNPEMIKAQSERIKKIRSERFWSSVRV